MIQIDNLHYRYKKKRNVFENLAVQLNPGQVYGLLGKNGAGKSTLLKIMSGLLIPQKGTFTAFGHTIHERNPQFLAQVFLVPEEFDLPAVSIEKFVKHTAVFYEKFDATQLAQYLNEFEIPAGSKLSALSFGQKKKFLLAFGLAANTRMLILDEPTNGLDIPSKSQFRKIVASAMTEDKIIIISTHQVRDLENLIEAVLVLEQGKIIFNQHIQEIAQRLYFEQDLRTIPEGDILYADEAGSRSGIRVNRQDQESRIDLEILFNAIIKNSNAINANFK